jgi:hypothetical protein
MSERLLLKKHLKKYDPNRPNIHFRANLGIMLKTFWRQIPIGPYSLTCQLNFALRMIH